MPRIVKVLALVSALALLSVSCASSKDTGFQPTPAPPTESETENGGPGSTQDDPAPYEGTPIDVVDNQFEPRFVVVSAGTTIEWEQTGAAPHTVTDDEARPKLQENRGEFDSHPECPADTSKCMQSGDTFEFTFDEPGEYPYYCVIHGAPGTYADPALMGAMIIVE